MPDFVWRSTAEMTVWAITGGAGHVGLELAAKLIELGHEVRLLDLVPCASANVPPGAEYTKGDVCVEADVWRLLSGGSRPAEVVCHLAGAGMSGSGMLDRALCHRVNVGGTELMIRCCRRLATLSPVRLIFMSSYNVCFHGQTIHDGDETLPYSPLDGHTDHYGPSKTLAEQAVLEANSGVLRTLSLRPGAIFGEREMRHLPRIATLMRYGASLVAFGSASAKQVHRDVYPVDDTTPIASRGASCVMLCRTGSTSTTSCRRSCSARTLCMAPPPPPESATSSTTPSPSTRSSS